MENKPAAGTEAASSREMRNVKIGIVVPVYHQIRSYVFECFEALEAQQFRNFRVVVWC